MASAALFPARGATFLELRGATLVAGGGDGWYRVLVKPYVYGHYDGWRAVRPAPGDTPADITLFTSLLDPAVAYNVTLEMHRVGWHSARAMFAVNPPAVNPPAEHPAPDNGDTGRDRRHHLVLVIAGVLAGAVSDESDRAHTRP